MKRSAGARVHLLGWILLVGVWACTDSTGPGVDPEPEPEVPRSPDQLLVERYARAGVERSWYTMASDGTGVSAFAGLPADAQDVTPSPDGRRLAFLRASGYDVHLWIVERDGSGARPVLEGVRVVHAVAWSPDAQRLVLSQSTLDTAEDLWSVRVDGTDARPLTADGPNFAIFDRTPAWSPDGTRIAFASSRSGLVRVWTMAADGTGLVELLPGLEGVETAPAWSADGAWLAFRQIAGGVAGVGIARPDGTGHRLFEVPGDAAQLRGPYWTSSGQVVFTSAWEGDYEVYRLDPVTGGTTNLTRRIDQDVRAVPLRYEAPVTTWLGFASPIRHPSGRTGLEALAVADVTGDGNADVLALAPGSGEVRLLRGTGGGGLALVGGLPTGPGARALAVADVSRDGAPDVLSLDAEGLRVWRGGNGGPAAAELYPVPGVPRALALGDFESDGHMDVAAAYEGQNGRLRMLVHGTGEEGGNLIAILDYPSDLAAPRRACALHWSAEGRPDVVVSTGAAEAPLVLLPGQGDISFGPPTRLAVGAAPPGDEPLRCADLNGDRRDEAILQGAGRIRIVSPTAGPTTTLEVGGSDVATGDVDRDGDVDLLVARADGTVAFLRNLGDGRFARPAAIPLGGEPSRVHVADLDGDGWPDLLATDADGTVVVALNRRR